MEERASREGKISWKEESRGRESLEKGESLMEGGVSWTRETDGRGSVLEGESLGWEAKRKEKCVWEHLRKRSIMKNGASLMCELCEKKSLIERRLEGEPRIKLVTFDGT